jgi:chorismate lyase/3-hydroxybenzoate synthase
MEGTLAKDINYLTHDEKSYSSHPQSWVGEMVGKSLDETLDGPNGLELHRRVGREFTLVTARLKDARGLDAEDFRQGVEVVYDAVFHAADSRNLVRVWNFIPGILEPLGKVDQRYKVFNAGRFDSYSRQYGGKGEFCRRIATASGIGAACDDFTVHALATTNYAVPIENPRQVPSYQYSKKYGSLPPCFARATRVGWGGSQGVPRLLVGGTASIRDETTYHFDELYLQLEETTQNLAAVVASGLGKPSNGFNLKDRYRFLLARYRYLRIYCPRREDLDFVAAQLRSEFENVERMELVCSDLCREGLLVEVEGWADLGPISTP